MTNAKTITNPTTDQSTSPASALWRIAFSALQSAEAEHSRISAHFEAAQAAYDAEVGEPNPDFETYSVNKHPTIRTREDHIRFVEVKVAIIDHAGQHLAPADYGTIAKKAAQLVDDYEADLERRTEAEGRILDGPQTAWEASLDAVSTARKALWRTPAPDAEAMLLKLDLLIDDMMEACADFGEEVAVVRNDARRLFGAK